jgi:uncharacterized protein YozE (UPF0346 family)
VKGHTKINATIGAIYQEANASDISLMRARNSKRLGDSPSLGDNVFDDEQGLARFNAKASSQNELSSFLFNKNKTQPQLAGDFLANHQSPHCWGQDGSRPKASQAIGQTSP